MKKGIIAITTCVFLAACATNPYSGESQVSKTAVGSGVGAVAGAGIGSGIGAIAGGKKGV